MTQEQLNIFAGVLCMLMAVFLSGLHVVSSQKRDRWMNLPRSVRYGVMAAIPMSLYRGIQFFTPEPSGPIPPGVIQAEGALYMLVLTYLVGSICFWVIRRHLPAAGWHRLNWVEDQEKRDPGKVPVMLDIEEVVDLNRRRGGIAVGPAGSADELGKIAR